MDADPVLARGGLRLRQLGQEMIEALGARKVHPAWSVPGGVREGMPDDKRLALLARLPEAQATARYALGEAARAEASRVHRVRLRVGKLAGVETDALPLAFEAACFGTAAEGAVLEVDEGAILCWCVGCGTKFAPDSMLFMCPSCGESASDIRRGRELELATVEVS